MNRDESGLHKITRPRPSLGDFRADLYNLLDETCTRPLVAVCAPQETGKSSLVSTYIERRNLPSIWYGVDKSDKDLATFFHLFGIAASEAAPNKKPATLRLPPLELSKGITAFSRRYFQEIYRYLQPRFLIVFDNYHEIEEDAALHVVIWVACQEVPPGSRIIVITRKTLPPLLAQLRASNRVAILEQVDLQLSPSEVRTSPLCMT